MRLVVKQKIVTLRDKYYIKDEADNDVFEVKASMFKIPKRFTVRDMQGKEIMVIKKMLFHIFAHFRILVDGQETGRIIQKFAIGRRIFEMDNDGQHYQIRGNINGWDFNIVKNEKVACYISKKIISLRDSYVIDIYDDSDMNISIATSIVMDAVMHNHGGGSSILGD